MQNFRISAPGSGVPLTALDNIIPFAGKRESGRDICSWHFTSCRGGAQFSRFRSEADINSGRSQNRM